MAIYVIRLPMVSLDTKTSLLETEKLIRVIRHFTNFYLLLISNQGL